MKFLVLALTLVGQIAMAKTEFWCEPTNRSTSIESILAFTDGGNHQLAVYTTSDNWGAVDERIETAERFEESGFVVYQAGSESLSVDQGTYEATYKNTASHIELEMLCEFP